MVPLQTATALFLALIVNNRFLKGKSFFRTAFYFPSVTSSVAISVVFLFLFPNTGAVNAILAFFGINGPAWFTDSRGLFHIALGEAWAVDNPGWAQAAVLGRCLWDVALRAVRGDVRDHHAGDLDDPARSCCMFLAALQDLPVELDEAAMLDGVDPLAELRLRHPAADQAHAVPGDHPRADRHLAGLRPDLRDEQGRAGQDHAHAGLPVVPASLPTLKYGTGAAISFILFVIIVVLTSFQRWLHAERTAGRRGALVGQQRVGRGHAAGHARLEAPG